ncbi:MAG TPA: PIG-L deacetylase family protein [Actinomycetota bacterium]
MTDFDDDGGARVVAVFTHPDDAEIGAGATLAKWTADGREVTLVVVSDGEKGSQDPSRDRDELVRLRKEEVRAGAARLGVRDVEFLDVVDGEVENTPELRAAIALIVRRVRPRTVVCPDPTAWFFGDPNDTDHRAYFNHRDHRMTGEAVLDAVAPGAGNPHFFPEQLAEGLRPWDVPEVWLGPTLEANHVEDVTGFVQAKLEALACHASQLVEDQLKWFEDWIPADAAEEGKKIGAEAGESFRVLRFV